MEDKRRNVTANIYSKKETSEIISKTLDVISDSLIGTLGPYGTTTIVQDRLGDHYMTKDGYSVLKQLRFREDLPSTILDIIRGISRNLVRTVGDGSTSSIIISNHLFKKLQEFQNEHTIAPKDIIDILHELASVFEKMIKESARPISDDMHELKNIAAISTNNDKELGELIHKIFQDIGRFGFVNIETSKLPNDYYEITSGIKVSRGFINFLFVNSEDKKTCSFEDPLVFMCNGILGESDLPMLANLLGEVCFQLKRPLVLVAKGYDSYVKTFLHENKLVSKDKLEVCAIDISVEDEKSVQRFNDLAIYLGATPYDKNNNEKIDYSFDFSRLGSCEKTIITEMDSRFIEGKGSPDKIQERIKSIEKTYNEIAKRAGHIDNDDELLYLRKRLASLQNSMAIIYVGGNTETEKTTRKFLVEDAIYACQSALEHGYIVGGNIVLPRILNDPEKVEYILQELYKSENIPHIKTIPVKVIKDLLNLISNSFKHAYKMVLKNGFLSDDEINEIITNCINSEQIYTLKLRSYETDWETMIINSCETDIEIIKASFSIIGLLATSNQFVSINF